MTEQYIEIDVERLVAFLDEVQRDLQANGADCMLCLLAAIGLMKQQNPKDFLFPINAERQGKLAILPCFHGEPERLPSILEGQLDPESGFRSRRFPPNNLRNIMLRYGAAKSIGDEYKSMGGYSPFNADCYEILERLKTKFPGEALIDLGFMDCRPFIEEKVVEAVNKGASKVIVVHTMIGVSSHTEEIEERVENLGLKDKDVELVFTEPLWNDEKFIQHKVNRTLKIVGNNDKSKVGVAILAYGRPSIPSAGRFAMYTIETNSRYANAYLKKLEEHGIKNTMAGYLQWLKPDISDCAKYLAEKGAKILVFDWYHTGRGLHSVLHIPARFEKVKADLPEDARLVMVGPEKDSLGFVDVLVNQIEKAKKRFEN